MARSFPNFKYFLAVMKLYLAGIYTSNFNKESQLYARLTDREKEARDGVKYYLESHHYIHKQAFVDKIRKDKVKVFLDSGAFSAFTKGVEVDLVKYCEYIKKNEDIIEHVGDIICASVLDGIGDPLKTWQNQLAMEQLGVRPLPCFHYAEDERYLEWYVANYPYITLGGMVPISTPQLLHWLDRIWEKYLIDSSGRPRLMVHGFGLTTQSLMERYPWYSVDSSSWVQIAANGGILIPGLGVMPVSFKSPSAKQYNRHLDTIPDLQKEGLVKKVEEQGFSIERLQVEYVSRWVYNCWAFTDINERLSSKPLLFKNEQVELF
jgi:hypothetical protein